MQLMHHVLSRSCTQHLVNIAGRPPLQLMQRRADAVRNVAPHQLLVFTWLIAPADRRVM